VAPYLALLGDIGVVKRKEYRKFILKMATKFKKVFILPGNHEYYRSSVDEAYGIMKSICDSHENLVFMHKTSYKFDEYNIRILGTSLWTHVPEEAKQIVQIRISDYSKIQVRTDYEDNPFLPLDDKGKEKEQGSHRPIRTEDTNQWHKDERHWLETEIKEAQNNKEKIIVFTHHAPIEKDGCGNPETYDDITNHAFSTDLRELMNNDVLVWAYGHTHWFHDMRINGTRVLSNPHGYPHDKFYIATQDPDNPYDPSFTIDINT